MAETHTTEQPVERDWFDTTVTRADYDAIGELNCRYVSPERIIVDLPDRDGRLGGEVNALAYWDEDYWQVESAFWAGTGTDVELTDDDIQRIQDALDEQRAAYSRDW